MPSIFLSHSFQDKPFARRLATALKRSGHHVWLDEAELEVGDSLATAIAEGLEGSDFVVAILSPASVASAWVTRELEIAMDLEIRAGRTVILPVLIGDTDPPPYLRGKLYLDFRGEGGYQRGLRLLRRKLAVTGVGRQAIASAQAAIRRQYRALAEPVHILCYQNRAQIEASAICGCFYCLSLFPPSLIRYWTFDTPSCPDCGIDSVLGSAQGVPLSKEFLEVMNERWFGRSTSTTLFIKRDLKAEIQLRRKSANRD